MSGVATLYTTQYRSSELPTGSLRKLGQMHVHVDGGGDAAWVLGMTKELESRGCLGKLTSVMRSLPGPQREEHPTTYATHTPGGLDKEELEYFSTNGVDSREKALSLLRRVLPELNKHEGAVVEVECVVATVQNGLWEQVQFNEIPPVRSDEVGFKRGESLPFEVHHAINLRPGDAVSLNPEALLRETTASGIIVGGWFAFEKKIGEDGEKWVSYRSNSFWSADGLRDRVLFEYRTLEEYMKGKGVAFQLWTIVEQVIGIWRSPLETD